MSVFFSFSVLFFPFLLFRVGVGIVTKTCSDDFDATRLTIRI